MNDNHDQLMDRLAQLDPVASDPAPAVGSPRFNASKERAMSTTHTEATHAEAADTETTRNEATDTEATRNEPTGAESAGGGSQPATRWRSGRLVGAVAAALIAVVSMALVLPGFTAASAAEKVRAAVDNTTEVSSLRILMETDNANFVPDGVAIVEVADGNFSLIDETFQIYVIDGRGWLATGESVGPIEGVADDVAPYGESSRRLLDAALQSNTVSEEGTERIGEVDTVRYAIEIDDQAHDAIAAVPSNYLSWFTEETEETIDERDGEAAEISRTGFLEDADKLTIWVADDLIHRISVNSSTSNFTHTYYDFNAPIEIVVPTS